MSASALFAVVLMAASIWLWPSPRWSLCRVVPPTDHPRRPRSDDARRPPDDPFAVAASLDLFAVCLRAGLPTGGTATIVARSAPPGLAEPLAATAELLALGADAEHAWRRPEEPRAGGGRRLGRTDANTAGFDALATLARRSSRAGSSLSGGLAELAENTRRQAHDDALAATERAGVAISGPLGLCFLPAFVCLGIVPVVIGLAGSVLAG